MGQKSGVLVKVTEEFSYRIDRSSIRTLPAGWSGSIPADAAKKLKSEKKGTIVAEKNSANTSDD